MSVVPVFVKLARRNMRESICGAIERFVALTPEERQEMGRNARLYAEEHVNLQRMVNQYEALLN